MYFSGLTCNILEKGRLILSRITLFLPLGGSFGDVHLGQIDGDHPHHLDVGGEKLGVISDGQLQVPVSYLFLLQGELKPTTQKHKYTVDFTCKSANTPSWYYSFSPVLNLPDPI